ncbi:MAG: hypothetical protein ACXAAH_15460, partial [Promethearchaeota archaeon]
MTWFEDEKMTPFDLEKKLKKYYSTTDKASHTFMTGGKLYINNEEVIELYKFFSNFEILPPLTERISKG